MIQELATMTTPKEGPGSEQSDLIRVERAIASVERAIDKLIPLLGSKDRAQAERAVFAFLTLGEVGAGRLGDQVFKVKDALLRYRMIKVMGSIATFDGSSVVLPLRRDRRGPR